jgi:pSer/pThr/pTyr-binding forkhead associated (FHA) protein
LNDKPSGDQELEDKGETQQEKKRPDTNEVLKARITTVKVADVQFETLDITPKLAKVPPDALGLFVMNSEQPVLIKGAQRVTLGRRVEGGTPVSIDLTDYGAALLGVSRQHAAILVSQEMYLLQDLGSTNGTWLNEVRLPPHIPRTLKNGDMIRLGQLRVYVVFHALKSAQDSETVKTSKLIINSSNDVDILLEPDVRVAITSVSKLTPHYLASTVAPYLEAIGKMQNIIDSIKGQKPHDLSIQNIKQGPPIWVSLEGASETIHLLRTVVSAWRSQHADKLSKAAQLLTQDDNPMTDKEFKATLRSAQVELAKEILVQIEANLSEKEQASYEDGLLGPLAILSASPLKVVPKT